MRVSIMRTSLLLFLAVGVAAFPGGAAALSGDEIMAKVDAVTSSAKDSFGEATMILIDKSGAKKERSMQMWSRYHKDKDDWSVVKFISPPDVRNLGFLSLSDDQMYLYMPAFDRIRRIASHSRKESFAGSDFANDDLSTGKYAKHYSAQVLKEVGGDYVLELKRRPQSERIYPRVIAYVNKTDFYIAKMELYDDNNKLWKTMDVENKKVQGYWAMYNIKMVDVKKNHQTVMRTDKLTYDSGLKDDIFTERFLKRGVKSE